jgi:hypothetical protein
MLGHRTVGLALEKYRGIRVRLLLYTKIHKGENVGLGQVSTGAIGGGGTRVLLCNSLIIFVIKG